MRTKIDFPTSKLWICLMTQNREKDIDELTQNIYPYVDGIIAVVNQPSTDKTEQILEERKGEGKIINRPFVKHHGHCMAEFLYDGHMKNGDWFFIVDSSDRITPFWLQNVKQNIEVYNKNGIGGVFLDRYYLVRYFDSLEMVGGVHWGVINIIGKTINLSAESNYKKDHWIINTRDNNKFRSAIYNPAKYYYAYGSTSQTQLMYQQFGTEIWASHENLRTTFRLFCQYNLKLDFDLESLIKYLKENIGHYPDLVEFVIETEINVKDLFRFYVLGQTFEDLCDNRFNWGYHVWKNTGKVKQGKFDGFIGQFNEYRINKGWEME